MVKSIEELQLGSKSNTHGELVVYEPTTLEDQVKVLAAQIRMLAAQLMALSVDKQSTEE